MDAAGRRPSIRDVAAAAGVSHQTVSRVLNDPVRVRPDTLARVEAAIGELGFRRSRAARSLVTRDSLTIGVIAVHAALFGPSQMALAIDEGARARGYATALVTVRDDSDASLEEAREHLLGLGVDGVVLLAWSPRLLDLAARFAASLPTCVVADGQVPDGVASVGSDQRGGAAQAVGALLAAGRTRIGHLAGPADWLESRARLEGWRETAGPAAASVVEVGWTPAGGYRGVAELLAADPGLDAVFAANDSVAAGALRRLGELGRRVPGDVALVGYDDIELAEFLSVPLASVRQPFAEVGRAAIHLLFELIEGGPAGAVELPSRFVWRASAGPVPLVDSPGATG